MLILAEVMLLCVLAVLLCIAALGDIRSYRIPNTLNLIIAGLAIPYWLVNAAASSALLWPQLILIAAVFVVMLTLMLLNVIGGGDAKLLLALAFWLQPNAYLNMIMITAIAGGVLCLVVVAMGKRHSVIAATGMNGEPIVKKRKMRIPYGVAIAAGGLVPISQLILNALVA